MKKPTACNPKRIVTIVRKFNEISPFIVCLLGFWQAFNGNLNAATFFVLLAIFNLLFIKAR